MQEKCQYSHNTPRKPSFHGELYHKCQSNQNISENLQQLQWEISFLLLLKSIFQSMKVAKIKCLMSRSGGALLLLATLVIMMIYAADLQSEFFPRGTRSGQQFISVMRYFSFSNGKIHILIRSPLPIFSISVL